MRLLICRLMALLLALLPMMGSVAGRVHAAGIRSHGQASPTVTAPGHSHATTSAKADARASMGLDCHSRTTALDHEHSHGVHHAHSASHVEPAAIVNAVAIAGARAAHAHDSSAKCDHCGFNCGCTGLCAPASHFMMQSSGTDLALRTTSAAPKPGKVAALSSWLTRPRPPPPRA